MTAQIHERIIYKDEEVGMCTEPLAPYLETNKKAFGSISTACWRGYIGYWALEDGSLYLIDIKGIEYEDFPEEVRQMQTDRNIGVSYIFPNQTKVKASWYTGTLRIPQGEMLMYKHAGYASIYERDVFIDIIDGKVISEAIRENETPPEREFSQGEIEATRKFWIKWKKNQIAHNNRISTGLWKTITKSISDFFKYN
jgi:hypothetical protein